MKKKILHLGLAIFGTIIGLLIITVIVLAITGKIEIGFDENGKFEVVINSESDVMDTYDQVIAATQTTYPTDIFVYGEDCRFREKVQFVTLDQLLPEKLESDKKYKIIIINDMHNNIDLTNEDFDVLYKYIMEEKYAFIYIGTQYVQNFVEKEFVKDDFREGSMGFCIRFSGDTLIQSSGLWEEEAQEYFDSGKDELLGQVIFLYIRTLIKEGENVKGL